MSNIIRLLPDHVANQIAAGEVVQRPASVVKELVENSVDAGATEIKLILKEAGKTLIQVIDNGKGMNSADALLAFERHATSKISKAEDLFDLHTKGFRGEALASIAAIAHVELKTRTQEVDLGIRLVVEGGKVIDQEPAVVPIGTVFTVKNLFYNIPARRNFLKSTNVEFRNVVDEFERIALVHPGIQFVLIHNDSEVFNLASSNARQRIVAIYGSRTNEKLVPIHENTEIVEISGFVGKPEYAKKSRGEQFFFVNDRFVKSGYLHHAVIAAYEGLLKEATHPSYFIYLRVPTDSIDINIHPTKTEVKFDDEQALYSILRATIKHSLGQFNVAPVLDFHRDATLDTPYNYEGKEAETPTIEVDRNFNPFERETVIVSDKFEYNPFENPFHTKDEKKPQNEVVSTILPTIEHHHVIESKMTAVDHIEDELIESKFSASSAPSDYIESKMAQLNLNDSQDEVIESRMTSMANEETLPFIDKNSALSSSASYNESQTFASKSNNPHGSYAKYFKNKPGFQREVIATSELYQGLKDQSDQLDWSKINIEKTVEAPSLFAQKSREVSSRTFQINRKYIVSPIKSGLVVIDQGRAHQRILYEKFIDSLNHQSGASQQLLFPLTLYYAPYEIEVLKELKELLRQTGFGFESFGQDFVVISGLPVHVSESEASIVLEDLITDFQNGLPDTTYSQADRIAKSLAHSLSVKTGTTLTQEEQENIVNTLFACNEPNVSPFMKPTFVTMNVEDIEKKFTL